MRTVITLAGALALGLMAGCASSSSSDGQALAAAEGDRLLNDEDNRRVCRRVGSETGSHLGGRRECRTVAEWRAYDQASRDYMNTQRYDGMNEQTGGPR